MLWLQMGRPFKGVIFFGLMLTEERTESVGVQRPLRRSGGSGCASAYEK